MDKGRTCLQRYFEILRFAQNDTHEESDEQIAPPSSASRARTDTHCDLKFIKLMSKHVPYLLGVFFVCDTKIIYFCILLHTRIGTKKERSPYELRSFLSM